MIFLIVVCLYYSIQIDQRSQNGQLRSSDSSSQWNTQHQGNADSLSFPLYLFVNRNQVNFLCLQFRAFQHCQLLSEDTTSACSNFNIPDMLLSVTECVTTIYHNTEEERWNWLLRPLFIVSCQSFTILSWISWQQSIDRQQNRSTRHIWMMAEDAAS